MHDMAETDHPAGLTGALADTLSRCTECGTCVQHCHFLERYGNPYCLAEEYRDQQMKPEVPFLCSLCGLCSVVCPEKLDPGRLFWLMRCRQAEDGSPGFRHHKSILRYEKWGLSRLFSLAALPKNCRTVFFPGCTFTGTRRKQLDAVFHLLQEVIPDIGLVLSCCAKPSHDLGRISSFQSSFKRVLDKLLAAGVTKVLTICPSCYQIFKQYGAGLDVGMVYEEIARQGGQEIVTAGTTVSIHDSCSVRFDSEIHAHIRTILKKQGLQIVEMEHQGQRALCCGEGGSACFFPENTVGQLGRIRQDEANGNPVIAYCAGCTERLSSHVPCYHVIDLFLTPEATLAGKTSTSRAPFTYFNRLIVKYTYKRKGFLQVRPDIVTPE